MNIKENIIQIIKEVIDPELGIDVYTLGLIYDLKVKKRSINIKMTHSCPGCPIANNLVEQVNERLKKNNYNPKIEVVFNPPWKPSEEIKSLLGIR